MSENNTKDEVKESFCGACLAVPLAFAGAGASAYGANSKGQHKQRKKIIFWSGIVTVIISLLIAFYYLGWLSWMGLGGCKNCR